MLSRAQLFGHLAMLAFSALVAGSFALGALAANEISPLAMNAARFWIAALVIGVAAAVTTGLPRSAFAAAWRYPLLASFFVVYFVLMFEGLKTAPPVSASAVFTLTPIMSAVFGWLLLRQVVTPRIAIALLVGGLGAIWVIFRADLAAIARFDIGRGEAIFFIGCVAHALYTPLVAKLNRGEPAIVFSFGVVLSGALILSAVAAPDVRATDWTALPPIVWITLAYISIAASSLTFVLLQFAAMRLPSSKVMAYTYLTPSWVILWERGLGGAPQPVMVLAGVALTMLSLILLLRQ